MTWLGLRGMESTAIIQQKGPNPKDYFVHIRRDSNESITEVVGETPSDPPRPLVRSKVSAEMPPCAIERLTGALELWNSASLTSTRLHVEGGIGGNKGNSKKGGGKDQLSVAMPHALL